MFDLSYNISEPLQQEFVRVRFSSVLREIK